MTNGRETNVSAEKKRASVSVFVWSSLLLLSMGQMICHKLHQRHKANSPASVLHFCDAAIDAVAEGERVCRVAVLLAQAAPPLLCTIGATTHK